MNNINPLVSVVVPVYNSSEFLKQCIDSLVNQTLKNIELIFVDDGSTDNSVEILEEYKSKDDRIKIICQQNQYAGVARNNGMKNATGKYIIFLDSDDFFELNMLEELYNTAEKNDVDIVLFGFYCYDNVTGSTEYTPIPKAPNGVFSPRDLGKEIYNICDGVTWNKMYLKSFVEQSGIVFQPLIHSNDTFFTRMIVVLADKMVQVKKRFVHYRFNNANSLQGKRDRNIICFGSAFLDIKSELKSRGLFEGDIKAAYINNMLNLIEIRFQSLQMKSNVKVLYDYFKETLVPGFFDSPEDLPENHISKRIYNSSDFEDFLEGELFMYRDSLTDFVAKTSIEYVIGKNILRVPRKIKRILRKK